MDYYLNIRLLEDELKYEKKWLKLLHVNHTALTVLNQCCFWGSQELSEKKRKMPTSSRFTMMAGHLADWFSRRP